MYKYLATWEGAVGSGVRRRMGGPHSGGSPGLESFIVSQSIRNRSSAVASKLRYRPVGVIAAAAAAAAAPAAAAWVGGVSTRPALLCLGDVRRQAAEEVEGVAGPRITFLMGREGGKRKAMMGTQTSNHSTSLGPMSHDEMMTARHTGIPQAFAPA
ncbi:uncharacterized protein E0L32_004966 [Thyridium curvatum]|uniref:Uncharacterized protein n=1 Tax=Thyridium curvatum TaxID=1093900 RepID=A0A507B527_9PEZI|nr:uncharacterized protein E0L32_004966 [Thyridium curvatum]TPX14857.1 hypothetical protein E0L32_004966 [Thyridium curvatum]